MRPIDHVNLAIVGCGGMGTRHLYGMKEYASIIAGRLRDHPAFRLVGGVEGRHAVAVVNALFESARLNQPVSVAAVEAGDPAVSGWQQALDAEVGLT